MKQLKCVFRAAMLVLALTTVAVSQEQIRVASYNIRFLDTNVVSQGNRLGKLQEVIRLLDARVIGLQEIDDREALKLIFSPDDWQLVIDDDSNDAQDVALAVKKPLRVIGVNPDLDADDVNFIFPASSDNSAFPNRRDVLAVEVQLPDRNESFFVMVVHSKSRSGGRDATDPRRISAARKLVSKLKEQFHDQQFILLGDFNDNPDDRSLNILETGDPDAIAGPEETDGPFMMNLMEPLVVTGHVSHGRTSADIVDNRINTIDPNSRARNNDNRGSDLNTGDILFDQILIPVGMRNRYVGCSAKVFDHEIAIRGGSLDMASDHLPVFADFVFGADAGGRCELNQDGLRIAALLPNPVGTDAGREEVTLRNTSSTNINLAGWKLQDRAGDVYLLSGIVPTGGLLKIVMTEHTMPLSNSGDDVTLITPQGISKPMLSYTVSQADEGVVITFP